MKTFQLNPERGNLTKFPGVASSCCIGEVKLLFATIFWLEYDWFYWPHAWYFFPWWMQWGVRKKKIMIVVEGAKEEKLQWGFSHDWPQVLVVLHTTIILVLPAENSHILLAHKTPFFFFSRQAVRECQNTAPGSKLLLASLQKIAKVQNPEKIIH